MNRILKRKLGMLLPGFVRSFFKHRMEEAFESGDTAHRNFVLSEHSAGLRCRFGPDRYFDAPQACRPDLVYLTETPRGRSEFDALASAAEQGGIFFDIGAHAGITSSIMCAAHPDNRVFSFEPSPQSCRRLAEIAAMNRSGERMSIENIAIGEKVGAIEMLIDPGSGFVQSQRFDHTMWSEPVAIQIQVETIALAAERLGVIPTFIKLDIEGYEYEAISASMDFLRAHKPSIFIELHLNYLEQRGLSVQAFVENLLGCGYTLYSLGGKRLSPSAVFESALPNLHILAR